MNKKLLLKVADAIEENPEKYHQGTWASKGDVSCGTTMCVAGWAAALKGWKLDFTQGENAEFASRCTKKGRTEYIENVANEVLDLPTNGLGDSRHTLFDSYFMRGYDASAVADELRRIAMGDTPIPGTD